MRIKWDDRLTGRLIELATSPDKLTEKEIAKIMSNEFGIGLARNHVHGKLLSMDLDTLENNSPRPVYTPYFNKYLDIFTNKKEPPEKKFAIDGNVINDLSERLKILKIGDTHIPFENDKYIQLAVNRNLTSNYIVIDEIMDCYSMSKFPKKHNIPFEVEIDRTVRLYEYLSNSFSNSMIILLNTNHSDRVKKKYSDIPGSLRFLTNTNINEVLTRPFPNIIAHNEWFIEINDAIFCHCERISNAYLTRMGSAVKSFAFFTDWFEVLGLNPFNCIAQGHTHQVNVSYERGGGCKIMETGCMCRPMDYPVDKAYGRPQVSGYGVVVQEYGVTNVELTREYALPTQEYYNDISKEAW